GEADASVDRPILTRMQEEREAVDRGKLRLETADHLRGADSALGKRFEIDLDAAIVQGGVCAVDADERRKTFDGRIFQYNISKSLLASCHSSKRHVLRRFRISQDYARVRNVKEPYGNVDVQQNGADESCHGNDEGGV